MWGMHFFSLISFLVFAEISTNASELEEYGSLRIVNGTTAEEGEFPYLVQVRQSYYDGKFVCAGTIIAEKWVLTAGHCIDPDMYIVITDVVVGTNMLVEEEETKFSVPVITQYLHPKFDWQYTEKGTVPIYDVALLELGENLNYSTTVQAVTLPEADANVPFHVNGTIPGWGLNSSNNIEMMKNLQKVNLHFLSDSECADTMKTDFQFDSFNATMNLCSDDQNNGVCSGDSGGPFLIDGVQYGIVSWSNRPCGSGPGVYTRVSNQEVRQFITDITGI